MKKATLFIMACTFSLVSFAQAKYQPKVVVLFMGEKNSTFDESKFPDFKFYYTPGITVETKETKSLTTKLSEKIIGTELEGTVYDLSYKGTPQEAYFTNMDGVTFFDKNGVISGRYKSFKNILLSPKKSLSGTYDFDNYDSFSKGYVKKGDTTKKAKKGPKKPDNLFDYYGMQLPKDFEVEDVSGKKSSLQSIVSGENLTLLYVLYFDAKYDLNKGLESGADKKGTEYLKDMNNTSTGMNRLSKLVDLEGEMFGYKVTW